MSDTKPGYIFNVEVTIGPEKRVTISGNFPMGATSESMTQELEKVLEAAEKQRIRRLELPAAEDALQAQKDRAEQLRTEIDRLKFKAQGGKLQTAEANNLENNLKTLKDLEDRIPKGEAFVAELRQKAA